MAPDVTSCRHVSGTLLELTFADGSRREVDVAALARPEGVFADVRSPEFVRSAVVNPDTGTVQWPTGADLSPEVLYAAGRLVARGGLAA